MEKSTYITTSKLPDDENYSIRCEAGSRLGWKHSESVGRTLVKLMGRPYILATIRLKTWSPAIIGFESTRKLVDWPASGLNSSYCDP